MQLNASSSRASMLTRIRQSEFIANITKIFAGNGLVFAVSLFATPVISRLYSPEDYGLMGLFVSIVTVVVVFATLKYETALVLPESDDTAQGLLRATLLVVAVVSAATLLIVTIAKLGFPSNEKVASLGSYIWWLPVAILMTASLKMLVNGWLTRKKQFGRMAFSEMSNSFVLLGVRITLGFIIGSTFWGLLVGLLAGLAVGMAVAWPESKLGLRKPKEGPEGIKALKQYPEFPTYTMPADFVRAFAQNLPMLMFGFMYSPEVAGLFFMANRLIKAPVELGLHAFRGVFLQKVSAMHNAGIPLRGVYLKTVMIMFVLGIGPALVLFFWGQEILTLILGGKWTEAGRFAETLSPLLLSFWVTSPAAMLLITLRRQNYWLFIQGLIALFQVGVFAYASYNELPVIWTLTWFVMVQLGINILLKLLVFRLLGENPIDQEETP